VDPPLKYALIAAGGSGIRMKSGVPKQFLIVAGRPVLMHAMDAFTNADPAIQLVVVLPAKQISAWQALIDRYRFKTPHQLVDGGKERFDSVRNGLEHVPERALVAIHDGVRPVVRAPLIIQGFREAMEHGSAIPFIPVKESVRILDGRTYRPFPRNPLRIIQTPQTFRSELIKQAYRQPFREDFTDDATVVEAMGQSVNLFEGDPVNIKITVPEDVWVVEALLQRIGHRPSATGNLY
jgi:2-C-methyl-D-erythritol 4-phosphate cytidylyltransferase